MFSPIAPNHNDIMATRIFDDVSECFFDPSQRDAPKSLQDFQKAHYIGLTFRKTIPVEDQTEEQKIQTVHAINQHTKIILSGFSSIPQFIEGTKRLIFQHLQCVKLPFYAPIIDMYMLWHKRYQNDPKHQWFRGQVMKSTEHLRADCF